MNIKFFTYNDLLLVLPCVMLERNWIEGYNTLQWQYSIYFGWAHMGGRITWKGRECVKRVPGRTKI